MAKYISISVTYVGPGGSKILQRGEFPVNLPNFKNDEFREAARVAKEFIEQIRRETGRIQLEQVLYDGKDITHLCI